ncbi:hypothetical protein [Clostridium sp. HBUAS56017]|uniref:hypothetical protein n=1 Tax=Clostridium sp. HBUAS56017 TaxID=2571128 RepID=UPI001178A8DA|nr:hypothetical protein [Clostridium sp. HBUAS56017]
MKKFLLTTLITGLFVTTSIFTSQISASASTTNQETSLSQEDSEQNFPSIDSIRNELKNNKVSDSKIDELIYKYENHIPWDNITENSKFTETSYTFDYVTTTKKVFEDGSYSETKLYKPKFATGISGGSVDSSTYHTSVSDCTVYTNLGFAKLAFKASYTINYGDYNDEITDAYEAPTVGYSNVSVSLVRSKETSLQHARAQVTGTPSWFTGRTVLVLDVGQNGANVYTERI